jgi:hypothetical protein
MADTINDSTNFENLTIDQNQTITNTYDTLTNVTTDIGNITYDTASGSYLVYDGTDTTWKSVNNYDTTNIVYSSPSGLTWYDISYQQAITITNSEVNLKYENDNIIEIKKDGIYINGKKETNPSKIGLVLLRMSESLNEKNINNIDDLE